MKEDTRYTKMDPVLCIATLRKRLLQDEKLVASVLQAFCYDVPPQIEVLEHACSVQDLEKVGRMAHKLKGTAGNIGAEMLYRTLIQLEEDLRADSSRDLSYSMVKVKEACDLLVQEIKRYI